MYHRFAAYFRIVLVAVAVMLLASTISASAAVAETRTVSPFGMCSHLLWGYSNAAIDRELDLMAAAGTRWVRIDVSWRDMEPTDNAYNATLLKSFDYVVASASKRGMSVVPVVMEFPDWANGSKGMWAPPTNDATFADFMQFMAARYSGSVTYWELGNEVNEQEFWAVAHDLSPARYTQFLKKGYAGVKAGNPGAIVISAGLAGSDDQYLQSMYDAGAKGSFDVLGVHPYTQGRSPYAKDPGAVYSTFDGLAVMKTTMERNGDATKKIWVTEVGWQTSAVGSHVTEQEQAQYTYEAFQRVYESFPYVETVFIYGLHNTHTNPNVSVDNYGLMTLDYVAKPAYAAYRRAYDTLGQATTNPIVPIVAPAPVVPQPTPTPTIRTSKRTVKKRASVILSGQFRTSAATVVSLSSVSTAAGSAGSAMLQRKVGRRWLNVRRVTANAAGKYSARVKFSKRGSYTYRVRTVGSTTSIAKSSNTVAIKVR